MMRIARPGSNLLSERRAQRPLASGFLRRRPPVIPGNRVQLLVDGGQVFPAMLRAINTAEHSVLLESYIFAKDATGRRFLDALTEAAARGVKVRVMVDGLGSLGTDAAFFAPLLRVGGVLSVYHAPWTWTWTFMSKWWRRDHRKLMMVDERFAFIGGTNIADAYAPPEWGGGGWHDSHALVQGPAALELAKVFARTWEWQTHERLPLSRAGVERLGEVAVQILESRWQRRPSIRTAYVEAIDRAERVVRLCNAYYIPDGRVLRALHRARRRGVRVQLILAGTTDVHAVRYASRALYSRMLAWGIEIYEWTDRVLHAKTAVIDASWCSMGSYNMDRRSLRHNLEANIGCYDKVLGAELDTQFVRDMKKSRRIDPLVWHRREWLDKVLERFFYKLRYLL
jgi:cardiolipin synthase A/B